MPSSNHSQISKIMNLITITNPNSVLDIGVGFGKYGFLSREYLELWDGRENYQNFLRRIDGIEAFSQYLTPIHDFIYDHIYVGEAYDIIKKLDFEYDLVLLIDVLEHFDKKTGNDLISNLFKKNKALIISVPKNIGNQKDVFSNPYEEHKSNWIKRDFKKFGKTFFVNDLLSHIVFVGDEEKINKLKKSFGPKNKFKEFFLSLPILPNIYHFFKKILFR